MNQSKTLQLNGSEVHYFEVGSGDPVLLLHGVPADARTWRYNLDVLAVHFRVLSPDLPAWGRSTCANGFDSSLSGLVAHLLDFSQALELDSVSLVGTGAGALIALEFALAHPSRTRSLVLSGVPLAPTEAPLNLSVPSGFVGREAFKRGAKGALKRLMQEGYAQPDGVDPMIVDAFAHSLSKGAAVTALTQLNDSIVERLGDLESELPRVQAPALIVHGGMDRLYPRANADRLAELLPNARIASIEYGGHFSHEELPAGYNNVVLKHLRSTVGA